MYTSYFGLDRLPFENVPDPLFFFDRYDYARVHSRIADSLRAGRGLIVVSGPVGSGKTTLSQKIISEFSHDANLIWMAEPPGSSIDLYLFIAQELGLSPSTSEKVFLLRDIKDALMKMNAAGRRCLVIIDESHLMSDDVINGIRMLNNLEEGAVKLVQIFLLGQQELIQRINRPEMENFKQRISALEIIGKMNPEKIRQYVSHRIIVAGGSPSIIEATGWEAFDRAFGSGCTPRVINSLCDRALNTACERQKKHVDVNDVYEGAKAIGLEKEIFFYLVSLKSQEKRHDTQPPAEGKGPKTEEPPRPTSVPAAVQVKPAPDGETAGRPFRVGPLFEEVRETAGKLFQAMPLFEEVRETAGKLFQAMPLFEEKEGRRLMKPLIFFILSVAALVLSFVFYCKRSGSPDAASCLRELLGL
ncbi:MAG: Flp pilus assembly complex ATPase component TadA [Nitrospiraceae bacterium]|nr:MAG: Flp pilus assembly complex ATPase component TadA [Nitrospiraceae bacterium]